jgi:hypothetical protein
LGLLGCAWPSKHSDFVAMHHRRKHFEGHKHPQRPQKYIRKLGGLSPINLMRQCRAQGLMWGARGPFLPAAAMVVAVVTPVVFCAKATERQNKNTKISCLLQKKFIYIIYCKTYCNSYIANCAWPSQSCGVAGARTTFVQWTPAYWVLPECSCHCENDSHIVLRPKRRNTGERDKGYPHRT